MECVSSQSVDCFHRAAAPCFAISRRRSGTGDPSSTISPVSTFMTWTALPTTSAGRFSPLGPLGIGLPFVQGGELGGAVGAAGEVVDDLDVLDAGCLHPAAGRERNVG